MHLLGRVGARLLLGGERCSLVVALRHEVVVRSPSVGVKRTDSAQPRAGELCSSSVVLAEVDGSLLVVRAASVVEEPEMLTVVDTESDVKGCRWLDWDVGVKVLVRLK
jgi:hypothetical protein